MAPQPPQPRQIFGDRTANHFAVFVPQPFRAIDKLAVGEVHEVRTYTNSTSFRLSCGLRRSKTEKRCGLAGQDVQLSDRARTSQQLPPGQGIRPDTPVRSAG
ncbi:TPA: hypothetical protein ACIS6J_004479, partial [Salmonella enterica subsp. enterica serovar Enteritidis]